MYSHGSSARVGVGRSGPGGRNYRPPKPKKNINGLVPPPLKACDCSIQLDIPEYAEVAAIGEEEQCRRLHLCFEGQSLNERKQSLSNTEKALRSEFGVHLVVPGRNQKGPLAVVGKSIQQALPAVDYLMDRLILESSNNSGTGSTDESSSLPFLKGRITRNVKDPNDVAISGRFFLRQNDSSNENRAQESIRLQPYWLFESDSWNVMVCPLSLPNTANATSPAPASSGEARPLEEVQQGHQNAITEALQISFDNLRFRIGNASLSELDIFLHPPPTSRLKSAVPQQKVFATGDPSGACIQALYQEIRQTRVVFPKATTAQI